MKTLVRICSLSLCLLMLGCAGMQARQGAMSTIATAYATIIQPVVLVGIGAEQDSGRIDAARAEQLRLAVNTLGRLLDGGEVSQAGAIRAAWDTLLPFALQGIDARIAKGEIGPGVGASLKETLRLFGERLIQLAEPPSTMSTRGDQYSMRRAETLAGYGPQPGLDEAVRAEQMNVLLFQGAQ